MPVKFRMSLMKVKESIRVTIPKEIVEALDLRPKDKVLLSLNDSTILIEPEKA